MRVELASTVVIALSFLFYGLIPGLGAFWVRARWRRFRKRLLAASLYPFVQYSDLSQGNRLLGRYRVFGSLEAIQGRNRIWLNSGQFTLQVDLEGVTIHLLPSFSGRDPALPLERLEETLPDEEPKGVGWDGIFSLPAGTSLFVAGPLFLEDGGGVFRSLPKEPLLVVIYDGSRKSILLRAIWAGRQRNEYWHRFTLASLITGAFSLLLAAYIMLRTPLLRLPSLFALTLGLFPIAALLPPGVVFNFLYRSLWKKARYLRAERDLLRLPLRYFSEAGLADSEPTGELIAALPDGEPYIMTPEPDLLIQAEIKIRGSSSVGLPASRQGKYFLFGVLKRQGDRRILAEPSDPMAESLLVLGDPRALSRACDQRAKVLELVSGFFFFLGVGINLFIILYLWRYLIR